MKENKNRILQNLHVGLDETLESHISSQMPEWSQYRVLRQSIDARRRGKAPQFVYSVEVAPQGQSLAVEDHTPQKLFSNSTQTLLRPIIVGTGPAGLFCALRLAERGVPSDLVERGGTAEKRVFAINKFWRYGNLDPQNNVCFGEGGAGLYSDGKLITRVKSPFIPYVLQKFVEAGAPEEIRYLSNPHIGSEKIRRLIPKLRARLLELGCRFYFESPVESLIVSSQSRQVIGVLLSNGKSLMSKAVVLAVGHSAEDTLKNLISQGVAVSNKDFALGLRIEHPQKVLNAIQYREYSAHPKLGSAAYKITDHDSSSGIGVYSFCMCPGGYVLNSTAQAGRVVSNGMSNYHRNSPYGNAAIVVSVSLQDHALGGGFEMREKIETQAFAEVQKNGGSKELPAQNLISFLENQPNPKTKDFSKSHSCPSGVKVMNLNSLLPKTVSENLRKSLLAFNEKMPGFITPEAHLFGVETRTSCPIRMDRDPETLQSLSHVGLYPAGEGAGYAGGITSAAVDGVRIAERITQDLQRPTQRRLPPTQTPSV